MSQIEYVHDVDESFNENPDRRPYGKMKVICNNKYCKIVIGPDYCFFIPAFSFFFIIGFLMTKTVFNSSQDLLFRIATVLICLGQPFSYLMVALSNPGIVSESVDIPIQQASTLDSIQFPQDQQLRKSKKQKYCKKCQIFVNKTTVHCSDCQLCIEQYDHHCPWVSKCIGKNNLVKFYIFLGMTPTFMIYSFISFFACAALDLVQKTALKEGFK